MVEHVEELCSKLEFLRFGQRERLSKRAIKNILTGANQAIAARITKGESTRRRVRIDVEPTVGSALIRRQVAIS